MPAADVPREQRRLLAEFGGWQLPQELISRPVDVMLKLGIYDR